MMGGPCLLMAAPALLPSGARLLGSTEALTVSRELRGGNPPILRPPPTQNLSTAAMGTLLQARGPGKVN